MQTTKAPPLRYFGCARAKIRNERTNDNGGSGSGDGDGKIAVNSKDANASIRYNGHRLNRDPSDSSKCLKYSVNRKMLGDDISIFAHLRQP